MLEGLRELREAFRPQMERAAAAAKFVEPFGIKQTCQYCPVQYEGSTPDGRVFYFRARWEEARMTIADNMDAAVDGVGWTAVEDLPGEYDGSWLEHDRAVWMMAMWLAAYEQEVASVEA